MSKRKKTPHEIETDVLMQSARRCCICFGLQMDLSQKKGQIAHLDGIPSNYTFDNLAYLCIPHHDDYDSVTRQSKGITIHEVKTYRTLLYEAIRQMRGELQPASWKPKDSADTKDTSIFKTDISELIIKIQSRTVPLSQCLAEALSISQKYGLKDLERFCRNELSGYDEDEAEPPSYRLLDAFLSFAKVNPHSIYWMGSIDNIYEHMRRDKENFAHRQIFVTHTISHLESQLRDTDPRGIITLTLSLSKLDPAAEKPNKEVAIYSRTSSYLQILEAVRRELTVRLLDLLPTVEE
ncbi:MAG: AbiTii domain-containing protein [Anaerolineales bacterium]